MGKLTAVAVSAAMKKGDSVRLADGDGLYLFIDKAARPYWIFRARVNGRNVERSLARADSLSLSDARRVAREVREKLEAGTEQPKRSIPSFIDAAREHHKVIVPTITNRKARAQWLTTIEIYVAPIFGDKRVDLIDEGDITDALLPIIAEKPETAKRVKGRIRATLNAAKGRGYRSSAIDWDAIDAALPKVRKSVKPMAAVPFAEMPDFYRKLNASPSHPIVRAALAYLIFTVVRPGNIRFADWSEIELDDLNGGAAAIWEIPADKMKARKAHRVPLPRAALDALEIARDYANPDFDYVFVGRDGRSRMSDNTLNKAVKAIWDGATAHGMRSAFKDWSLSEGYPDHLSELQLAHTDPNAVRAAYARTDLLDARREMMEAWADFVTGKGGK